MNARALAIRGSGLVTSVGLSTAASCSAFRAKVANPCETRFIDSNGAWIMAHRVDLDLPWTGLAKLTRMAALSIQEALADLEPDQWSRLPLLLCVAEIGRPGRMPGLDDQLFTRIQTALGVSFARTSAVVPHGRVGVAIALSQARELLRSGDVPGVLIVGVDSLLSWPTLSHYERGARLLTEANSDGFMPGEGAGALWVAAVERRSDQLLCTGIGFGLEPSPVDSGEPLRADGLTQAIKASLGDAGSEMHDMAVRITDNSGEQYYFKEASLALSRTLRQFKESFELWHPAECTGETGAASGVSIIATALEACRKGYAPGPNVLAHWANDSGQRAAVTLRYRAAA